MDVHWLEQSNEDLPERNDWLSAGDATRLNSMRFEKRRADWRLGRWTAKRSVATYLHLPVDLQTLAEIEIRSKPSGAPEVFVENKPANIVISLSHRAGTAICAIANSGVALGCDLEIIEARSDAFVTDYFTTEEQELVARSDGRLRSQLLALLWSGKESALKALGVGLRLDTRCLVVDPMVSVLSANEDQTQYEGEPALWRSVECNKWHAFDVRFGIEILHGWWQHAPNFLRTLVAAPSPSRPIPLVMLT